MNTSVSCTQREKGFSLPNKNYKFSTQIASLRWEKSRSEKIFSRDFSSPPFLDSNTLHGKLKIFLFSRRKKFSLFLVQTQRRTKKWFSRSENSLGKYVWLWMSTKEENTKIFLTLFMNMRKVNRMFLQLNMKNYLSCYHAPDLAHKWTLHARLHAWSAHLSHFSSRLHDTLARPSSVYKWNVVKAIVSVRWKSADAAARKSETLNYNQPRRREFMSRTFNWKMLGKCENRKLLSNNMCALSVASMRQRKYLSSLGLMMHTRRNKEV